MGLLKDKWFFIKEENDFKVYIKQPIYKKLFCSENAYWKDTITGENCGNSVGLAMFLYNNDGSLNINCFKEENHYELVVKGENNE